jgi:hypothetical protein
MRIDPDACRDPDILAAEVRRLQAVIAARDTLTDAEREAVECGIQAIGLAPYDERTLAYADTLWGLLERTQLSGKRG